MSCKKEDILNIYKPLIAYLEEKDDDSLIEGVMKSKDYKKLKGVIYRKNVLRDEIMLIRDTPNNILLGMTDSQLG
jgi:hypothetical protein